MRKASPRGILSPDRLVLSPRQRQEYLRLKLAGLPDATARQLAFAFEKAAAAPSPEAVAMLALEACASWHMDALGKAEAPEDAAEAIAELALEVVATTKAATHYERRFVAGAKAELAPEQYAGLHARARGQAGGHASATSRAQAKDPTAALSSLWDKRNALTAELAELDKQIAALPMQKDAGPMGTTHVDVPIDVSKPRPGKKRRKGKRVAKQEGISQLAQEQAQPFRGPDAPADQRMVNAARLISGMDYEMMVGANDLDDARARASRVLSTDLSRYDRVFVTDQDLRTVQGFDIDIGSGQARQKGYLGLDLYPYDHGTTLCDVSLGLPFAHSTVRSVRLVNSLEYMPDYASDATPLMQEVQRVLNYGGKLFYEGTLDLEQAADFGQLPGLLLVEHEDTTPALPTQEATQSTLHRQVFERVRVRVPRIYGADPEWMGADENTPSDVAFALEAMGIDAPAQYAMADLLGKTEATEAPPKGVQAACKRGLELAPEYGGPGLTDGAKARARSMANGEAQTPAQIKRMKAYFARHTEERSSNPPTPGQVAWLLWGGDAGKSWAEGKVAAMGKAKGKKPMGAAFAHARASGKDQSKEGRKRRANRYLREQGHAPIGKAELELRIDGGTPIVKAQAKDGKDWQKIFTSVIYAPNELDTDGEYIEPQDLVTLAHQAFVDRVPIKLEHSGDPIDCHLVESYIAPVAFELSGPNGPQSVRKGSWVGTFKANDEAIWQAILDGKLRGVSVGGLAAKEER